MPSYRRSDLHHTTRCRLFLGGRPRVGGHEDGRLRRAEKHQRSKAIADLKLRLAGLGVRDVSVW